MNNFPDDDIANWICSKHGCGFMATDKWMKEITPEIIAQLKQDVIDTVIFRQQQAADREVQVIERARREVEAKKTVHDVAREHKKITSLSDFVKGDDNEQS